MNRRRPGKKKVRQIFAGAPLAESRRAAFLQPLRDARQIIVADGLLCRTLQRWQPRANIISLGFALSRRTELRRHLEADDLYVIEPRAYHADVEGLVRHYDDLRHDSGCAMNLDLQRIAIPATARNLRQRLGLEAADDAAQTRWLLQGRRIARIVVEDAGDIAAFRQVVDLPVVHLVDCPGFLVGLQAEQTATIRAGVRAMTAIDQCTVPWCTVIVRNVFGVAGALHQPPGRLSLRYAWPSGHWGSLPLEGGIEAAYRADLDAATDPAAKLTEIEDRLNKLRSPFRSAETFWVEEIIDPRDTRKLLCEFVRLAEPLLTPGPASFTMRP